ncbi:MAG: SAM-dependent methyltransferase [Pseudomonadota bacterium]
MSFTADWLALRADADRMARDAGLVGELAALLDESESVRVLDLGAGTGASLAAISPVLPAYQTWVLADHDAGLLSRVEAPDGIVLDKRTTDLSGALTSLFDPAPDLVTASAFFDLCGAEVADRLAALTAKSGAAFYTALSYDGRQTWLPSHPDDDAVLAAFNADQRRDKGLGPGLGHDATDHLAAAFRRHGYTVETARSDWQLSPADDAALIAELARGTAEALAPVIGRETADEWHRARACAEAVTIGHLDILAIPSSA